MGPAARHLLRHCLRGPHAGGEPEALLWRGTAPAEITFPCDAIALAAAYAIVPEGIASHLDIVAAQRLVGDGRNHRHDVLVAMLQLVAEHSLLRFGLLAAGGIEGDAREMDGPARVVQCRLSLRHDPAH
jgi:hypothetical protein